MIFCFQEVFDTILDAFDQFGFRVGILVGGGICRYYVSDKDDLGQIGVGWRIAISLLKMFGEGCDTVVYRPIEA